MHIPGKLDVYRQYPVFQYKNNATLFSTTKKNRNSANEQVTLNVSNVQLKKEKGERIESKESQRQRQKRDKKS